MNIFKKKKKNIESESIITFTANEARTKRDRRFEDVLQTYRKKFWDGVNKAAQAGKLEYHDTIYYFNCYYRDSSPCIGYKLADVISQINEEFKAAGFTTVLEDCRYEEKYKKALEEGKDIELSEEELNLLVFEGNCIKLNIFWYKEEEGPDLL